MKLVKLNTDSSLLLDELPPAVAGNGLAGAQPSLVMPNAPSPWQEGSPPLDASKPVGSLSAMEVMTSSVADPRVKLRASAGRELEALAVRLGIEHDPQLSAQAQRHFVEWCRDKLHWQEDAESICWVRNHLAHILTLSQKKPNIAILRDYFTSQGIRLLPGEKLPPGVPDHDLDRQALRAAVQAACKPGKVMGRREAMRLLSHLEDVKDVRQLAWANGLLCNYELAKGLTYDSERTRQLVQGFFAERLSGPVSLSQVSLAAFLLRQDGFSEAAQKRLVSLLDRCHDDDVLFYAQRAVSTQISKAKKQAVGTAGRARIEAVESNLREYFTAHLQGKYDRHSLEMKLRLLHKAGKIDMSMYMALDAAVVTSSSVEEFQTAVQRVKARVLATQLLAQLALLESECRRTDQEERAIRAREDEIRLLEDLRLRDEIKRLAEICRRKIDRATRKMWLANFVTALDGLACERDPARRADTYAELARTLAQMADLPAARGADN